MSTTVLTFVKQFCYAWAWGDYTNACSHIFSHGICNDQFCCDNGQTFKEYSYPVIVEEFIPSRPLTDNDMVPIGNGIVKQTTWSAIDQYNKKHPNKQIKLTFSGLCDSN